MIDVVVLICFAFGVGFYIGCHGISLLSARVDELEEALQPFVEHGLDLDDPDGSDLLYGLMRDRICDWFGPSDFLKARKAMLGDE